LAQLCEQALSEDVREDLREVRAEDAQVRHVLLCEADAVSAVHQLQDAQDTGWVVGVTDCHGEVSRWRQLVLVGEWTVEVEVQELRVEVHVGLRELIGLIDLTIFIFLMDLS